MDVREIRAAFTLSESIEERVLAFRRERVSQIIQRRVPLGLRIGPQVLLHLLPLGLHHATALDLRKATTNPESLRPLQAYGFDFRHNLDGFVVLFKDAEGAVASYTQLFRTGALEYVDVPLMGRGENRLYVSGLEDKIIEATGRGLDVQNRLGLAPPIVVGLTLAGVRGYKLHVPSRAPLPGEEAIDRDHLDLPEVLIGDYDTDVTTALRPIFDALWNAAGWPRSMNYDEEGKRQPQP